MTNVCNNYAEVLLDLALPTDDVTETERIFKETPLLIRTFTNPLILEGQKERVIERVFPQTLTRFLKVACRHGRLGQIEDIFTAYKELLRQRNSVLKAKLLYVTPPDEPTVERMRDFLKRRYKRNFVELQLEKDVSLIGGFLLKAEDFEYDYSLRGRYTRLAQTLIRR